MKRKLNEKEIVQALINDGILLRKSGIASCQISYRIDQYLDETVLAKAPVVATMAAFRAIRSGVEELLSESEEKLKEIIQREVEE
jgi:hypothetical protein